jgi:hypothetical protein
MPVVYVNSKRSNQKLCAPQDILITFSATYLGSVSENQREFMKNKNVVDFCYKKNFRPFVSRLIR